MNMNMMHTMLLRYPKTLLTGRPGVGKTTLVKKIIDRMPSVSMDGFYTKEIRAKGTRLGFELQGLSGHRRVLAHVDVTGPNRVGKYGVDTAGFERYLAGSNLLRPDIDLIVIDEIGKMELFSNMFRGLVLELLNTDKHLLATIAFKGGGFIRAVKQRSDVHLFEITPENRDRLPDILKAVSKPHV